jgi:hypothetical protein
MCPQAYAQTRYLMKTVTITVPTVLDLQVTSGANPVADFNQTDKIDNGIEIIGATSLTYRSNKAWFATIRAASADFSGGVAGNPMPASVIQYRISGSGNSYSPVSSIEKTLIAASGSKYPRGTGSTSIDFMVDPGYNYPPAQNYTLQLIYTISNL